MTQRIGDYVKGIVALETVEARREALAKVPMSKQATVKVLVEHAFSARSYLRHRAQVIAQQLAVQPVHRRKQEIAALGAALRTEVENALNDMGRGLK